MSAIIIIIIITITKHNNKESVHKLEKSKAEHSIRSGEAAHSADTPVNTSKASDSKDLHLITLH